MVSPGNHLFIGGFSMWINLIGCAQKKFPAMNQCWNDYYIHFHSALPMESHGIHEVLRLKSYQIQWNLVGSMRFYNLNLIKTHHIQNVMAQWFRRCLLLRRSTLAYRGGINPVSAL